MAAPTFVSLTSTVINTSTSPKLTTAIAVNVGDRVLAFGANQDQSFGVVTPTVDGTSTAAMSGGFSLVQSVVNQSNRCDIWLYTGTVTTGGNLVVSFAIAATAGRFGGSVWILRNSDGFGASTSTHANEVAPSLALVTNFNNSAVLYVGADWDATTGTATFRTINSATPISSPTTSIRDQLDSGQYRVYGGVWGDVGAAGSKTTGLSAPSGQKIAHAAIEIRGKVTYTMTADVGSYALTGTAATLLFKRKVVANVGSYTLSEANAGLNKGYKMQVDSGVYALAGTSVALLFKRILSANSGSYTLSGTVVALSKGYKIVVDAGVYNLTGTNVSLLFKKILIAGPGAYVLTGVAVVLKASRLLTAETGLYNLTGTSVTLTKTGSYSMIAEAGAYNLSGTAAALLFNRKLPVDAGVYSLTGTQSALLFKRLISAQPGAYTLTGTQVDFIYSSSRVMVAQAGVYVLTGTPVTMTETEEEIVRTVTFITEIVKDIRFETQIIAPVRFETGKEFSITFD